MGDRPTMQTSADSEVRIVEVFADITCPFTHVGLRRLVRHRESVGRNDVVLRVRAWPLELVNGEPLTGEFVEEEIQALRETVAPDLFGGFDAGCFPGTSMPALALAASAYARDDRTGEHVSLALRTALFENGSDISDTGVRAAIARSVGLDAPGPDAQQPVLRDWHEGRRRGVKGSPHFFVDDRGFFCPTLDIRRIDGHLQVELDREAFARFVAVIFDDVPTR